MPEAVPEGVSRGFTALIPGFVVAFVVIFINGALVALGTDIFKVIAIPFGFVANLTNSWIGLMIIYLLTQLLWIVGIHGANIIFAFVNPIALANMAENAAGGHYAVAGEFSNMFVIAGGSGATLGLCLYIAFAAKSEQLKAIGRASVVPALFNINEPLIFGLPIIYNPALAIPFILTPALGILISYLATAAGFMSPAFVQVPWTTPVFLNAWLATAGDFRAILVQLVIFALGVLLYIPFIKVNDKSC